MRTQRGFIAGLICMLWPTWAATAPVHHSLDVTLQPDTAGIEVRDTVTLPEDHPSSLTFTLHPDLKPTLPGDNVRLI
jgi:hypothetical protein